ncbi:MAG: methylenetetrahydrofolate reductase C-terminal domain-containing protein [Candidatus Omnitrophica bacterium]|nr:methylenetetrahydrofolate reductase C-terminal domain-containing protein [Candidatus Omnitrophota bacterium]
MIITRQKPIPEIMEYIKGKNGLFLVGCELCATTCKTGGSEQVKKMAEFLKNNNKEVTGWVVLDPACSALAVRKFLRENAAAISKTDAILCLACGGGTQAISEIADSIEVIPCNDTLFQGELKAASLKGSEFAQKCSLCGDCMLAITGGICPITHCPKGLVNGPCGGVKNGKCEVDESIDCVWINIYNRLKKRNKIAEMKKIRKAKDHSKDKKPQKITTE